MAKVRTPVVAYLRTSSAANVGADKDSDKRQRAAIDSFAKRASYEIIADTTMPLSAAPTRSKAERASPHSSTASRATVSKLSSSRTPAASPASWWCKSWASPC